MTNRYFSEVRQFRARVLAEEILAPPADISLTPVYAVPFFIPAGLISAESRLTLHRIGVFSNFADGLVFKNAGEDIQISVRSFGVAPTATIATPISGVNTVKALTGDFTGIGSGAFLQLETDGADSQYVLTASVGNGAGINLTSYPEPATANSATLMAGAGTGDVIRQYSIRNLNYLEEVNDFFDPGVSDDADATDIVMVAQIIRSGTEFLTKSINTAYADDVCYFDVVMELEYTPFF